MLGNKDTDIKKSFGIVLRQLRTSAGLSQEDLALDADVERNYISLIELGKNSPTINVIFKLSKALNIPPSNMIKLLEKEINQIRD